MLSYLWRWRKKAVVGVAGQGEEGLFVTPKHANMEEPAENEIITYLQKNPLFLEKYVLDEIDLEQLERWIIRKSQRVKKTQLQNSDQPSTVTAAAAACMKSNQRKTSLSRWRFCVHADKRQMLLDLTHSLQTRPTKNHVLWELANCISSAIGAHGFRLYIPADNNPERLVEYLGDANKEGGGDLLREVNDFTVTTYVARSREPIRLSKHEANVRFPSEIIDTEYSDIGWHHALWQPVTQPDGRLAAVLQLIRTSPQDSPFHEEDEEIVCSYLVWGGIALHYAQLYRAVCKQRALNDFLLDVAKSIFQDMISMDTLVSKIMNFAQRLVDADRASLFLVDNKNKELHATLFDVGIDSEPLSDQEAKLEEELAQKESQSRRNSRKTNTVYEEFRRRSFENFKSSINNDIENSRMVNNKNQKAKKCLEVSKSNDLEDGIKTRNLLETSKSNDVEDSSSNKTPRVSSDNLKMKNEIRFPLGTGIAGQVAMTGDVLNITDAYSDPRFNRTVDQLTGYKTHTILCMPIFIRGSIIGVVQMVNKRSGVFTKEDEEAFEMFAVYCGLALHHAKLYDKIRKSEQKYRVAMEVLSYHNTCSDNEVQTALDQSEFIHGIPENLVGVDDYYFSPFELDDYEKVRHAMFMFTDLFGLQNFDKNHLIRFMLTVKKNYRRVPYHNWTHGFSVANCMYTIIKHSRNVFRSNEALALFIGALCHDLDHRGKNNKFMSDTESPLAAIYTTSTMERHHFNQTVTILQQEGHNIFSKLTNTDYKQVLGLVKHCILATDLALFFPNKTRLAGLVSTRTFSWTDTDHRALLMAVAMTGSDLAASAKPWDIQAKTVSVIFEEFYQQGDEERAAGRQPISMMDRYQPDQQASSQVGFLTSICVPCYQLINELLPQTKPLLDQCQKNLHRWKEIDEKDRQARLKNDDRLALIDSSSE